MGELRHGDINKHTQKYISWITKVGFQGIPAPSAYVQHDAACGRDGDHPDFASITYHAFDPNDQI